MQLVYANEDPTKVHLVKGLLENEGIRVEVQNEFLSTALGGPSGIPQTNPSIWVLEPADFDRASHFVEAFIKAGHAAPGPAWKCPTCGEKVQGQFTRCWKCGGKPAPQA